MESGAASEGGVGSIVWVLRRSGTWWPGKIMGTEELPASNLASPRTGIPVKLIRSVETSVYWCNLENSTRVKAFRCGEFDDCIERAESTQGLLPKTRKRRNRREDAIRHALKVEKEWLRKQGKLNRPADARNKSSDSALIGCGGLLTSIKGETVSSIHFPKDQVGNQPIWEKDNTKILPQMRRLPDFELNIACVKQELTSNDALDVDDTQSPSSSVSSLGRTMHINGGEQMGCDSRAKRSRCKYLPPESFDVLDYNKIPPSKIEISSSHFREGDTYPSPDYMIGGKISEFMEVVGTGFSESTSSESESDSSSETEPDMHEDITSPSGEIGLKEASGGASAAQRTSTPSRANCFWSENPSFIINVQMSHIKGGRVQIPTSFVRNYLTRKEAKVHVVLKDEEGRTWPVHLYVCKKYSAWFALGWRTFALDNALRVGDSCAYELLKGPEMFIRVTIYRYAEDSNDRHMNALGSKMGRARRERELNTPSRFECDYSSEDEVMRSSMTNKQSRRVSQRISSKGTTRAFKRVSELRSDHPFFTVVITTRFLHHGQPSIPKRFSDEHIDQLPKDVTLVFKGESWPMTMKPSSDRSGRFSAGWHAFTRGNKLKVGDVCRFEMIEKTNVVLKVSISRDGLTLG